MGRDGNQVADEERRGYKRGSTDDPSEKVVEERTNRESGRGQLSVYTQCELCWMSGGKMNVSLTRASVVIGKLTTVKSNPPLNTRNKTPFPIKQTPFPYFFFCFLKETTLLLFLPIVCLSTVSSLVRVCVAFDANVTGEHIKETIRLPRPAGHKCHSIKHNDSHQERCFSLERPVEMNDLKWNWY